jgi:nucleotide-binding universal stress UspA family protein
LIVMSSHGYKGLAYSMKGSITEKVTRYANCPVLCLKNEGQHFIK